MDLLALSLLSNLIVALFICLCAALILIILLQKGRGGGIGAAFGGGGAGSLLGTKTGDFLTWVTITLVAAFLILAVLMGKFMRPSGSLPDLASPVTPQVPAETPVATPSEIPTEDASAEGETAVDVATDEVSEESTETPAAEEDAVEPAEDAGNAVESDSGPISAEEPVQETNN
jgi:preprotein translocase subunit SecG